MKPFVLFREAERDDYVFILDSWQKSYGRAGRLMYHNHHALRLDLITRCPVIVAANEFNRDQIIGWVCYERLNEEDGVVHYIYVKSGKNIFRKKGIADTLLTLAGFPKKGWKCSHPTYAADFFQCEVVPLGSYETREFYRKKLKQARAQRRQDAT